MDRLKISDIRVEGNKLSARVSAEGKVAKAFKKTPYRFSYECSLPMEGLPRSIAVLPALGNILPLVWLFDARLELEECDADFLRAIPEIKKGYAAMYPTLRLGGELAVRRSVENPMLNPGGSVALFSGGLDSQFTALRHAAEKPALLILRGADISVLPKDDAGWEEILRQVDEMAGTLGVERVSVVTNFREIMDYRFLNEWTTGAAGTSGTYWYCFQHGVAMLTHAAPVAWQKQLRTVYIASSYTEDDEGKTTCASDPSIDDHVRFCGAQVVHDGYEYNRLGKLAGVAQWCRENRKKVFLRVCHSRPKGELEKTGRNCCTCEKCYRTILGLYALRENPVDYGFNIKDMSHFGEQLHGRAYRIVRMFNLRYLPIIKLMRENYREDEIPEGLRWFYDFKLSADSEFFRWVDRRIVIEHEKRIAMEVELHAHDRAKKRLSGEAAAETVPEAGGSGADSLLRRIRMALEGK